MGFPLELSAVLQLVFIGLCSGFSVSILIRMSSFDTLCSRVAVVDRYFGHGLLIAF